MNSPKLPTTKSLEGVALAHLLMGEHISHLSFQGDTRSYCLRGPIFNLRAYGFTIDDCWHAGNISRVSGQRTRYKKYFISAENLQVLREQFGERLNKFVDAVNSLEAG